MPHSSGPIPIPAPLKPYHASLQWPLTPSPHLAVPPRSMSHKKDVVHPDGGGGQRGGCSQQMQAHQGQQGDEGNGNKDTSGGKNTGGSDSGSNSTDENGSGGK